MSDKSLLVVFSNPTEGREEEFNDWYDNTHLREVCEVPGITGAARYYLGADDPNGAHKYLAIYNLEGDTDAIQTELGTRATTGVFNMSEALDMSTVSMTVWKAR
jgi:hypothetical protein